MTFLIVLHVLVCLFMVFVILLQPGKSDGGIGFGSSSQSVFGSKGAGNFLTKTTSVCAVLFLVTSFFLTRYRTMEFSSSVIKDTPAAAATPTPLSEKPVAPLVPATTPEAEKPLGNEKLNPTPAPAKK